MTKKRKICSNVEENPITAINIDTAYLKWKNKFPTVAICFRKGELTVLNDIKVRDSHMLLFQIDILTT